MNKQKHKYHQKNYKSLKVRIYTIEQMLDRMSRRMKRSCASKAKAFFKGLGGWWANTKESIMARAKKKPMASKRGGKRGGKKKRG